MDYRFSDDELGLPEKVVDLLTHFGFEHPSPIQRKFLLEGHQFAHKANCLVTAKSGTGKTLVIWLAVMNLILQREAQGKANWGLIICPTPELVFQVFQVFHRFWTAAPWLQKLVRLEHTRFWSNLSKQRKAIRKMLDTESRFLLYVGLPSHFHPLFVGFDFPPIQFLVCDEVDYVFHPEIFKRQVVQTLYDDLSQKSTSTLFTSATMVPEFEHLVAAMLEDESHPLEKIYLNPSIFRKDRPEDSPKLMAVKHSVVLFDRQKSIPFEVSSILRRKTFRKAIIFVNNHQKAKLTYDLLADEMNRCGVLHRLAFTNGTFDMDHRLGVLKKLADNPELRVVIASDLLARGVDCGEIDLVICLDLPYDKEMYLHRSGRCSRFGRQPGECTTLLPRGDLPQYSYFMSQYCMEFETRVEG